MCRRAARDDPVSQGRHRRGGRGGGGGRTLSGRRQRQQGGCAAGGASCAHVDRVQGQLRDSQRPQGHPHPLAVLRAPARRFRRGVRVAEVHLSRRRRRLHLCRGDWRIGTQGLGLGQTGQTLPEHGEQRRVRRVAKGRFEGQLARSGAVRSVGRDAVPGWGGQRIFSDGRHRSSLKCCWRLSRRLARRARGVGLRCVRRGRGSEEFGERGAESGLTTNVAATALAKTRPTTPTPPPS
mmetsp:Transcript_10045/g.33167  ORF Transcript_10045/g.33167 Transcript_10045/m.33167 type:complete len:237 (-) Transcript_10045:76-786(-)